MQIKHFIKKRGGVICAALNTISLGAAVYFTVKGTIDAVKIVEEEKPETKIDVVRSTWKCYRPAAGAIGVTVATNWAGFALNKHNYKEVLGAYTLMQTTSGKMKSKVKEIIGDEKLEEIRNEILSEQAHNAERPTDWGTNDVPEYDWYYEPWSSQFFYTTESFIKEAIHKVNGQIEAYQFASLNDLLDELGLRKSIYGDELGWWTADYDDGDKGGFYGVKIIDISFVETVIDGQECKLMKYTPIFADEYWGEQEHPEDF